MTKPVLLELASLPREQIGPYLILGLPKEATRNQIEENWADRIRWVRRNLISIPLGDINWAREMLSTEEKQAQADAASLNTDTASDTLAALLAKYGFASGEIWKPVDVPTPPETNSPAIEIPTPEKILGEIQLRDISHAFPQVPLLLEGMCMKPIDPWALDLPSTLNSSTKTPRQD